MSRPDRPLRRALRFAPLAGLLLLTSCTLPFQARAGAARVDVANLPTDILFGVPSPSPHAARAVAPEILPPMSFELPEPADLGFAGNGITFPTIPAPAACAAALPTQFPAEVATPDVTKMPVAGAYRWAAGGQYEMTVLTQTVKVPLPMFEQRVVRRAAAIPDPVPALPGSPPGSAFTYQTIEPNVSDGTALLMYWQVKTNGPAGDPEGGLVLKQVDALDKNGKFARVVFKGATGLLFLPLPVAPGMAITSTAVDSAGGNSLQLKGTVGSRETVDACGTPIQAWGVDATLTSAGTGAGTPTTIHYDVATQMGALMVAFNVDGKYLGVKYLKATARIGQATGDPVPEPYK
jgi:hypothetical protein